MTLGERIALARKQAGLSQEQLGEKLGVSSDWLLLGEESAQNTAPERCPGCQTIVSGLDQFCPNRGRGLRGTQSPGYTVLLKRRGAEDDLIRLSKSGIFSCFLFLLRQRRFRRLSGGRVPLAGSSTKWWSHRG